MPIQNALDALSTLLGQRLTRSKSDLELHGRSETHFPLTPPDAVAYPETSAEVSELVKICAAHRVPVVGWGTGTSLEGQAQAVHGGVVVDFSRMNKLLEVRQGDMDAAIQPGLTREELNEELRATGLFFPVDPGANASLGGMAMTRASGTTAVRYGTMRENVMGLEVVLADGRIIRTGSRARKSSAGYDLTGLMVGSEGTLGLITELTLKLHGQPEAITAAICAFDNVDDAVRAVIDTIQLGLAMARIELLDTETVKAFNAYSGATMPECPHLMVEFHGSESGVEEMATTFGEVIAEHDGHGFNWATRPEDRTALWTMRHNGAYAIYAARPGWKSLVTDVCVPISRLADAINETATDLTEAGLYGPILGHVGDGNFHSVIMFDPSDADQFKSVKAASNRMVERALAMGGTATGEHGIGLGKLDYMQAEHGQGWAVMGAVKRALDPDNIMNPGKLVPPSN
ncbi:FAD-linked oxidase C-terminal domain-containing protein [Alisedimentitalea sp. MJ-SS2]|uniref:FAD-binding oxidoreductase n=1 Tax=Aliisedimentitalea sp. MJ-SS2 TaxID=3049795 RepID=UPI0029149C4D|nr:FAD-linked oxidase C-terminal domain-containing protein [Alisedimentitalea sp. MJ-SS2]MDU8928902.1 FAD-linked oxidase C-terminal domain-containing protein [Alisedimentitalea sp. MJ-SS2]